MFTTFPGTDVDPRSLVGDWGYVMEHVEGFDPGDIIPGQFVLAGGFVDFAANEGRGRYIHPDEPILAFCPNDILVFAEGGGASRPKFVTRIQHGASIRRIQRKTTLKHEAGWDHYKDAWQCLQCLSYSPDGECVEHVASGVDAWEVDPQEGASP